MAFLDDKSPHNTRFCWPQSCDGEKAVSPFYLKFQYFGFFFDFGEICDFSRKIKKTQNIQTTRRYVRQPFNLSPWFGFIGFVGFSLGKSNKSNKSKPRDEMSDSHSISSRGLDLLDLLDFPREIQ
jgi:hypothetical protein